MKPATACTLLPCPTQTAHVPQSHLHVLLDGTKFIQDELTWFRAKMAERGLDAASAPQHGTCARYCRFLDSLGSRPYADCAVAFWAIEAMYLEAWAGVLAKVTAMCLEAWAGVSAKATPLTRVPHTGRCHLGHEGSRQASVPLQNPETPYKEFAMRWASDGFRAYVAQLRQQADEAVASLSSGNWAAQAEDLVRDICVLEKEFWGMAWGA